MRGGALQGNGRGSSGLRLQVLSGNADGSADIGRRQDLFGHDVQRADRDIEVGLQIHHDTSQVPAQRLGLPMQSILGRAPAVSGARQDACTVGVVRGGQVGPVRGNALARIVDAQLVLSRDERDFDHVQFLGKRGAMRFKVAIAADQAGQVSVQPASNHPRLAEYCAGVASSEHRGGGTTGHLLEPAAFDLR